MASSITSFTPLKCPIANDGDKSDVVFAPDAQQGSQGDVVSQKYGIPLIFSENISNGGKFIGREDINGLLYIISQFQFYMQSGGFPTFDENVSSAIGGYPEGAVLFYANGEYSCFVKSRSGNNNNDYTKNPDGLIGVESDNKPWIKISPSIADVNSGNKRIVVVDSMPSAYDPGTYYFIRG